MPAAAYLLLPVSGLIVYLLGPDRRARFQGLQAIALGLVWPLALYAASALSPGVTRAVFALGAVAWLALMLLTAAGKDPRLPLVGRPLMRAAESDPRAG